MGISFYNDVEVGFEIKGATLTINSVGGSSYNPNFIRFTDAQAPKALFKLSGVGGKSTALVINSGNMNAGPETPLVKAEGEQTSVTVNGGDFGGTDSFLEGETDFKVNGGLFDVDPSEYVGSNAVSYFREDGQRYVVLKLDTAFSDTFKTILNSKNEFAFNGYKPTAEEGFGSLRDWFVSYYSSKAPYFDVITETYNNDDSTVCISLLDSGEMDEFGERVAIETHRVKITFNYEQSVREDVKSIITKVPEPENPDDYYYSYSITDLELVNYWAGVTEKDTAYQKATKMANVSGKVKELFGYKNYSLEVDTGIGMPPLLETEYGGIGFFKYNGGLYGSKEIGFTAKHIIYLPSDTADNATAKAAAAEKRIKEITGLSNVKVETTTVEDAVYVNQWQVFKKDILEETPDATFEKFLNDECGWREVFPEPDDEFYEDTVLYLVGSNDYTADSECYSVELNGIKYFFMVECSSEKIEKAPEFKATDVTTNVTVNTDADIPLDTQVQVKKLESGEEYEKIIKLLDVEENATYEINLYSPSADEYITKLESGKFEIRLPIPENLKGKKLAAYYVDENGKITEYEVTIDGDYAIFYTDHFSIYVLSQPVAREILNPDKFEKEEDHNKGTSPATGSTMPLLLAFAFVCMTVGGYFSLKVIKN